MRISDWSSDVCSSDLKCTAAIPGSYTHIFQRKGNSGPMEASAVGMAKTLWPSEIADTQLDALRFVPLSLRISIPRSRQVRRALRQIGRASCRERVCQYV